MLEDDQEQPKLRIDARVVRQLGAELITDPEQALLELIKNAYDADADICRVNIDTDVKTYMRRGERISEEEALKNTDPKAIESLIGRITIENDGPIVPFDTIKDRWLLISGSHKRPSEGEPKQTTDKERTPLGDKGIGRLGTMRLGDVVQFISKQDVSGDHGRGVEFRWSEFDSVTSLDQVPVRDVSDALDEDISTRVQIDGLISSDHWVAVKYNELQVRLSKLISPYSDEHPMEVEIKLNDEPLELQSLREDLELYAVSNYSFSYSATEDGYILRIHGNLSKDFFGKSWKPDVADEFFQAFIQKSPKFGLKRNSTTESRYIYQFDRQVNCEELEGFKAEHHPGPFNGALYALNFTLIPSASPQGQQVSDESGEVVESQKFLPPTGSLREFFQNLAGVSIFRDGFGIRIDPDWIGISEGTTKSKSFYSLRKVNTIGHVDITSRDNSQLVEKSDREGFVDTPAWRLFLSICQKVRDEINLVHHTLRRDYEAFLNKGTDAEGGAARATPDSALTQLEAEASYALKLSAALSANNAVLDQAMSLPRLGETSDADFDAFKKRASAALDQIQKVVKSAPSRSMEGAAALVRVELQNLRAQVSAAYDFIAAGMAAETLAHEVHPMLNSAIKRVNAADKYFKTKKHDAGAVELQSVRAYLRMIGKQLSLLNPMLKVYRETKDVVKLEDFLNDYKAFASKRLADANIKLDIKIERTFTIAMPRGRLMQVVDNIVRNAEYWLRTPAAKKRAKQPTITIEVRRGMVSISDNGLGVKPELEEHLFEMFVTDKPSNMGKGLGLFITREILTRYKCDIELAQVRNPLGRRFRFDINLAAAMK